MSSWYRKFACAFAGVGWSLRTQSSFWVHCFFAIAAIAVAGWLRIERSGWTAIVIAITIVMVAELFNTVIEELVKAIHPKQDQRIGRALDISAGAVLFSALAAITIGLITLGPPLVEELRSWFG